MQVFTNWLAASLTIGAFAFYVVVYTLLLKRTTPLNIVIGGAAGALPPVIGWAAVTGGISVPALLMFAIVTAWTPPHFWALSINYSNDYARAGVPMLPVVAGPRETSRQILLYSLALVTLTLLLAAWGETGVIYLASACVLGAGFLYHAIRLWRDDGAARSAALFRYSIVYLGLLFVAIAADGLAGGPWPA
jgi:protoheme IX farnesyltransferase